MYKKIVNYVIRFLGLFFVVASSKYLHLGLSHKSIPYFTLSVLFCVLSIICFIYIEMKKEEVK